MNIILGRLCPLILAALLFASCLKSDSETTLYGDTAITNFYVSAAPITVNTTTSSGNDTTYRAVTTSVTSIPFHIDQVNGLIFNEDSLPLGTDATKLLVSWSTRNNGSVLIKNIDSDTLRYLTTTDSTDFSSPRQVRVYSSDATAYRTYTISVNVHKEKGDEFSWTRMADAPEIAALGNMRAVYMGERIYVFGSDGTATAIYHTAVDDGNTWTRSQATLGAETYDNVVAQGNTIYVLDGQTLKATTNGETFANVGGNTQLARLVAAGSRTLYAYNAEGDMLVSDDGGLSWWLDETDATPGLLPKDNLSSATIDFAYSDSTDYIVLAGGTEALDSTAVVWRRLAEYSANSDAGQWALLYDGDYSSNELPRMSQLTLLGYGSNIVALGGAGLGGSSVEPLSQMYVSRDGGLTWKASSAYTLPSALDKSAPTFCAAVDLDYNIWMMCGGTGQVWRGRLNRMAWD